MEYLVHSVTLSWSVSYRHIVKSEITQKAKEEQIPNLSVFISAFLCSYSFHPLTHSFHLSSDSTLSPSDVHSLLIWSFPAIHFFTFICPIQLHNATWTSQKYTLSSDCLPLKIPLMFHAVLNRYHFSSLLFLLHLNYYSSGTLSYACYHIMIHQHSLAFSV